MQVASAGRVPIYFWTDDWASIEVEARRQAENLANLPFAYHHVALMPDVHSGYGMPIGGVLATEGVVIPNAVGVDIGCGMLAFKTTIVADALGRADITKIFDRMRATIPVGFNHHLDEQSDEWMPKMDHVTRIVQQQYTAALKQIGTLGGGNHFIEFQKDQEGIMWVMIHSGSRNIGHKVASYYNERAQWLNEKYFSSVPKEWDLAFLPIGSDEAAEYLKEMRYCVEFAARNRMLMSERVKAAIADSFEVGFDGPINIAHNFVIEETHYGRKVWVHRKGATPSLPYVSGIIPGSQGTASYIVEGMGKPESFCSNSHGAGRRMGRKAAQRTLNLAEETFKMEQAGVLVHGLRGSGDLDEAPGSYKDIDWVMSQQTDLVKITHTLRPIAVMKG